MKMQLSMGVRRLQQPEWLHSHLHRMAVGSTNTDADLVWGFDSVCLDSNRSTLPSESKSKVLECHQSTGTTNQKEKMRVAFVAFVALGLPSTQRLLRILLLLVLNLLPSVTAQYGSCFSQILWADGDADRLLSSSEYAHLITRVTSDAISEPYDDLEIDLVNVFVASQQSVDGVDISAILSDAGDVTAVESFCFSMYTALVDVLQISTTQQQCLVSMAVYDRNRDDLLDLEEYIRFAARLEGGVSVGSKDLLRSIFDEWAKNDTISVVGSKPGSLPTDSEIVLLENLCRQVLIAITVSENPPEALPTPAPFGSGQSMITPAPTIPGRRLCFISLVISDLDRNDLLNSQEYVRLVNRLSQNQWVSESYETLPMKLRDNFVRLVDETDQIPVFASKPGRTPTEAQQEQLNRVCFETIHSIDTTLNSPISTPTNAPFSTATSSPTLTIAPITTAPTRALEITSAPTFPRKKESKKGMQKMKGMGMAIKMGQGSNKQNGVKRGKGMGGGSVGMSKRGMRGARGMRRKGA
jgi:hypothetical protein